MSCHPLTLLLQDQRWLGVPTVGPLPNSDVIVAYRSELQSGETAEHFQVHDVTGPLVLWEPGRHEEASIVVVRDADREVAAQLQQEATPATFHVGDETMLHPDCLSVPGGQLVQLADRWTARVMLTDAPWGPEVWTIVVDDGGVRLSAGADPTADAHIQVPYPVFAAVLTGDAEWGLVLEYGVVNSSVGSLSILWAASQAVAAGAPAPARTLTRLLGRVAGHRTSAQFRQQRDRMRDAAETVRTGA